MIRICINSNFAQMIIIRILREVFMSEINKLNSSMPTVYSDLPFGEQLILWGMRMWAQALNQDVNISDVLREGFRLAGVQDAFGFLDSIMYILATAGRGVIDIRCPGCSEISADEHRLLGAIAIHQCDFVLADSDPYLCLWLPPAALRIAREPTIKLAKALQRGGLALRSRTWVLDVVTDNLEISNTLAENHTIH